MTEVQLRKLIDECQEKMIENLNRNLYGDCGTVVPHKKPTAWGEVKRRFANAYDCIVKGADPYDGW